jgi:hypothetical protein
MLSLRAKEDARRTRPDTGDMGGNTGRTGGERK